MISTTVTPRLRLSRVVTLLLAFVAALVAPIGLGASEVGATPDEPTPNTVVNSAPENGSVLSVSPDAIVIIFADDLGSGSTISVDCDGEPVTLPATEVIDDTTLQVEIPDPLPAGTCVARYRATDADGQETATGPITFVVQNDTATAPTDTTDTGESTPAATVPVTTTADAGSDTGDADPEVIDLSIATDGDPAIWLFRLLSTLGIAVLFGGLILITAAWPEGVEYLVTIRFLRGAWILAVISTFILMALAAAAVTPNGGGGPFSPGTWADLLDAGWAGRALVIRMLLVAGSAWVAFRPDRAIDPATQLAALGVPGLAAAMIGVSRTSGDLVAVGVLMGIGHAVAMSVWVGGVVLLSRVVLAGPGDEDLVHAVRGFSRISTPAILITIITGLVQMIRLVGTDLFGSGYGRVVLLKTIVVAAMIFVAFSARQFVAQRMNRAHQLSVPLADRLRRAFGAETLFGLATLALSSWLLIWIPPGVDATPSIDYAVSQEHSDAADLLDARVRFTDDRVGQVGLEVLLRDPIDGLSGLTVVLTAPEGSPTIGAIRQPVPLQEPGYAVRTEALGLPLVVAGQWTVRVEANTTTGTISSADQIFPVLNADGSEVQVVITAPTVEVVEIPADDEG
ncbi:MAG: copper resistance CopC/CopD family protein [Ilumatobacter sp.]